MISLAEIYIADGIGIMLMASCLVGCLWRMKEKNQEDRALLWMIIVVIASCLADSLVFTVNGRPGKIFRILNYIGNIWVYLANVFIGPLWVVLIDCHINGVRTKLRSQILNVIFFFIFILNVINIFCPLMFIIDENNIYSRGPLFWINVGIETFFMADSFLLYLFGKARRGILKFFPVLQFFIPMIICTLIQNKFYGLSLIWPGVAVSITSLVICLQNENLVIDKLTGIFNRYYLEKIKSTIKKQKLFSIMMMDMNGFKLINDKYGHSEGDEALVNMAKILRKTVGASGTVVRYAGDEFVVLLNTGNKILTESIINSIQKEINNYNLNTKKNYTLSISIGHGIFDMRKTSWDDVLKTIDRRMYKNKAAYYKTNVQLNRRS